MVAFEHFLWGSHNFTVTALGSSDRGDFWALPIEILVLARPTGYMLTSSGFPLLNWGNLSYSIDSSKMIGNFPAVLNFIRLFLKPHTGSSVTNCRFSPIIAWLVCGNTCPLRQAFYP